MLKTGEPRIVYFPSEGVTPEAEVSALAGVYRYILDSCAKQEAAPESRPDDAMKGSKHDRATTDYTRT